VRGGGKPQTKESFKRGEKKCKRFANKTRSKGASQIHREPMKKISGARCPVWLVKTGGRSFYATVGFNFSMTILMETSVHL